MTAKPYDSDPLSDLAIDKDTRLVLNADGELVLAPSMRPAPAASLTDDLAIEAPEPPPSLLADEGELGPMEEGLVLARVAAPEPPAAPLAEPPTLAPHRAKPHLPSLTDDLTSEPPPPAAAPDDDDDDEPIPLALDAFEATTEPPDDDILIEDSDDDLLGDAWSEPDPDEEMELLLTEDDVVSSRSGPAADPLPFASLLASSNAASSGKLPPFPPPPGTPAHGTAMPDLDAHSNAPQVTKPSDPFVGEDAETPAVATPDLGRRDDLLPVTSDLVNSPSKIEATVSPLDGASPAPKPRAAPSRRASFAGRKIREKSRTENVASRVTTTDLSDARAEPYFARGLASLEAGDLGSAERDLAIAMTYAPSNERYRAAFAELKRRKGR